ncbi:MAG: DUF3060 domain-containing protein [Sphingobacteriales bacterium]|nr:DUF3060 domain-containing protein [Sphingobacteriales bacterium]
MLSGNDNKITFKGSIGKYSNNRKNNDITIVSVKQIIVPGSGNFVSWEKSDNAGGKPVIQDKGGYNNIERRSDNAMDQSKIIKFYPKSSRFYKSLVILYY